MVINCGLIPETSEYDSRDTIDSHSHTASENEISDLQERLQFFSRLICRVLIATSFFWPCKIHCSQNHKMFRLEGTSGVVLSIPLRSCRANWLTYIQQEAYEYQTRKSSPLLQLISFLTSLTKKGDRQWQHSSWLASLQAVRGSLPTQHSPSHIVKPHTACIMTSASFIFIVLKQVLLFSSSLALRVCIPVQYLLYCYPQIHPFFFAVASPEDLAKPDHPL